MSGTDHRILWSVTPRGAGLSRRTDGGLRQIINREIIRVEAAPWIE